MFKSRVFNIISCTLQLDNRAVQSRPCYVNDESETSCRTAQGIRSTKQIQTSKTKHAVGSKGMLASSSTRQQTTAYSNSQNSEYAFVVAMSVTVEAFGHSVLEIYIKAGSKRSSQCIPSLGALGGG